MSARRSGTSTRGSTTRCVDPGARPPGPRPSRTRAPRAQAKALKDKVEERKRLELQRQGCTFTPKLSKRASLLQRPGTATERLYKPEWVRSRRLDEHK